jgi:hypothetical protein
MTFRITDGTRKRDIVATTRTHTTHHVEVDLVSVLAEFDPTDEVFLIVRNPSGRDKRIRLDASLFVSPNPTQEDFDKWN